MKNIKKSIFFTFLSISYVFSSVCCATVQVTALSPEASEFYEKVQKELGALQAARKGRDMVNISKAKYTQIAPNLSNFLSNLTENLIKKTTLTMPSIFVYIGDGQGLYNASMQKTVTVFTHTSRDISGKESSTQIVQDKYKLTLGRELVNLFLWKKSLTDCFEAVIAHEIGHAVNNHTIPSIENEYAADRTAVKLLKSPWKLPQGISVLTLAGHIYNTISAIADDGVKEHIHFLVRVLTASLVKEFPNLGELGRSSSHTNFARLVQAALAPIISPEEQEESISSPAALVIKIHERLRQACLNPGAFMGVDDDELSEEGEMLDELTNRMFSPITHPAPRDRLEKILHAINDKCNLL